LLQTLVPQKMLLTSHVIQNIIISSFDRIKHK
jgi:hypothetical protein